MKKIFLITSGTYSNAELVSDFGLLPTSFLPVGHKRLFELQFDLISSFDGIKFMTLPEDFVLSKRDKAIFELHNINVFRVNPNLNLSQSILEFLNSVVSSEFKYLCMLHGDTLFKKIDFQENSIYFSKTDTFYKWGYLNDFKNNKKNTDNSNFKFVMSGYFTFNDIVLLKEKLKISISFEKALKSYDNENPFNLKKSNDWLDFGHSNLYYKSKRNLNVTRSFNEITIINNHIKKESLDCDKIKNEFHWFNNFPDDLKVYLPSVWNLRETKSSSSYMIEFIGAPTLQEKFVFGTLPTRSYFSIIDIIFSFISKEKNILQQKVFHKFFLDKMNDLYVKKTKQRLDTFIKQLNYDNERLIRINSKVFKSLDKFKEDVINDLNEFIYDLPKNSRLSLMHGDLCFSNILFDSRTNLLKIIDPRGGINSEYNDNDVIFGDYRYDISKLGHSLIGNYDFIVSGFFNLKYDLINYEFDLEINSNYSKNIEQYFYEKANSLGAPKKFLKASITNLFLSMLPLHSEDRNRQIAFLINAYKIYYN